MQTGSDIIISDYKKKLPKAKTSGKKKQSIMIDMDSVLLDPKFVEAIENYLGKKIDIDNVKNFYIQDEVLGDKKADFFSHFDQINLYEGVELFKDCYDVLYKYHDKFDIYICTDYIWKDAVWAAGSNVKNKYDCLRELLPFLNPWNFIFTGDKSIVQTDIKLDDKAANLKNTKLKILYTAWHNYEVSDEELTSDKIIRVNNWQDVGRLFEILC